jgi:hypothetical protein
MGRFKIYLPDYTTNIFVLNLKLNTQNTLVDGLFRDQRLRTVAHHNLLSVVHRSSDFDIRDPNSQSLA